MTTATQVYIYLLDEGTDVWRPVDARSLGGDRYQIVGENFDPEDEQWEFITGDVVRCEQRTLLEGINPVVRLVAVEKIEKWTAEQEKECSQPGVKRVGV